MPAYSTPITRWTCDRDMCSSKATVEVFDAFNGFVGRYCAKHGAVMVDRINQERRR